MFRGAFDENNFRAFLSDQIRQHARLFFRLAYGVLRDPAAAEDICQQAMLKAWERRSELRNESAARGWLARIVLNESLQARRQLAIERRAILQRAAAAQTAQGVGRSGFELSEAVVLAMQDLPETTRLVVAMRVMQGKSGNEVKAVLGCSAAEISRQLHRGMELLRQSLVDWQTDL